MRYFGRPLSFRITPLFHNTGWTANGVTAFRTALTVLCLICIGTGQTIWQVPGAALFYLIFVLDCVDGNLARLHDSASYWGKFSDGLSDYSFTVLAPVCTGIGCVFAGYGWGWLALGAFVGVIVAFVYIGRDRRAFFVAWMERENGAAPDLQPPPGSLLRRWDRAAGRLWQTGRFLGPIMLLTPFGPVAYLIWQALFQGLGGGAWFVGNLIETRCLLGLHRKSRNAA